MPRAIVFIKGSNWDYIENKLQEIFEQKDTSLITKYGTILEYYLEAFGNPDFIASLWSTNIEQLKSSILYVRKACLADTKAIIGIDENERAFREHEMKDEIANLDKAENRIKQIIKVYVEKEKKRVKDLESFLS